MSINPFPQSHHVDDDGVGSTPLRPVADVVSLRASTTPPLRLGLVGASDLVRRGLHAMLSSRSERVQLLDQTELRPSSADVVLVDVHSTAPLGPRAVAEVAADGFAEVWAYGWGSSPTERRLLREAGARGYLSMRHDAADLVEVLEETTTRRVASHPGRALVTTGRSARELDLDCLTAREVDVVTLVCRGLTNTEIAHEMYISINTVKTFVRSAYRKMGVVNRTQCLLWGIARGL